jgi:predicted RNA binding protein YcfA (HicA-like mRNA interferase family)
VSKLPRDVTGDALVKAFMRIGYQWVRQTGSHVRLKGGRTGEEPLTVPRHNPIKVGTLNSILDDAASQTGMSREQLLEELDL